MCHLDFLADASTDLRSEDPETDEPPYRREEARLCRVEATYIALGGIAQSFSQL